MRIRHETQQDIAERSCCFLLAGVCLSVWKSQGPALIGWERGKIDICKGSRSWWIAANAEAKPACWKPRLALKICQRYRVWCRDDKGISSGFSRTFLHKIERLICFLSVNSWDSSPLQHTDQKAAVVQSPHTAWSNTLINCMKNLDVNKMHE